MAWVAPVGIYFLFVTGACRTEQHRGPSVVCVLGHKVKTHRAVFFCVRLLKINCERRSLSRRDGITTKYTQAGTSELIVGSVEIIIQPALKSPRLLPENMLLGVMFQCCDAGAILAQRDSPFRKIAFFIFHGRPFRPQRTERVFSYFFLVIVTADLTIKTLSKQRR
jgi:hypothetical protein